jgi:hypothetical protein
VENTVHEAPRRIEILMADRYFHVDVSFMHKRTADVLYQEFGHAGPLVFLALCAQAKNGRPPGTFEYENEPLGWFYLGLKGREPDFTLEEFFKVTGKLKQTAKRRQTHGNHVVLTQYARWQKDARRLQGVERQRRYRAKKSGDDSVTVGVTPHITETSPRTRSRTRTTPQPPNEGKPPERIGSWCPICEDRLPPGISLVDHINNTHGTEPQEAA